MIEFHKKYFLHEIHIKSKKIIFLSMNCKLNKFKNNGEEYLSNRSRSQNIFKEN